MTHLYGEKFKALSIPNYIDSLNTKYTEAKFLQVQVMLNKNTLGVKKARGQEEVAM